MGEVGSRYGRENKCTKALVRRHEGKKPFEKRRRRWEDTEMHLQERGWEDVDWINLAQDRDK